MAKTVRSTCLKWGHGLNDPDELGGCLVGPYPAGRGNGQGSCWPQTWSGKGRERVRLEQHLLRLPMLLPTCNALKWHHEEIGARRFACPESAVAQELWDLELCCILLVSALVPLIALLRNPRLIKPKTKLPRQIIDVDCTRAARA